jgi:hypothetical protein
MRLELRYIGNDAAGEAGCWLVGSASPMGATIKWDVIHFNEGLHSLWPRVNTSAELAVWAEQLANFTKLIMRTQPQASPKRCSHSDVPLYILLVIIHTKYTGLRQNDSNV